MGTLVGAIKSVVNAHGQSPRSFLGAWFLQLSEHGAGKTTCSILAYAQIALAALKLPTLEVADDRSGECRRNQCASQPNSHSCFRGRRRSFPIGHLGANYQECLRACKVVQADPSGDGTVPGICIAHITMRALSQTMSLVTGVSLCRVLASWPSASRSKST